MHSWSSSVLMISVDGRSIGKITPTFKWYHIHIESCLEHCTHMSLCEMSHSWLCECLWRCVHDYFCFGDTCTFVVMVRMM